MRTAPVIGALVLLVLAVAGCGGGSSKPYTAAATAPCLRDKGFTHVTTDSSKVGFIAGFAANGGLQARTAGNTLTIAFTGAATDVPGIEKAFRNAAPKRLRPHMRDITESQGNAVLVWTVTPSQDDLQAALGCLKS
jgi:hypothetical protein